MSESIQSQHCGKCGAALSGYGPDGLCAACLLECALDAKVPTTAPPVFPRSTGQTMLLEEDAPGTIIGRYKLLEKVGEGGFGVVHVAEQREPVKRRVALKIIKLGMDTRQVVARFEAERQALALMDHPNIAKVLDGGATETGRPYFVMELVRGVKITDYCDQNNLATCERLDLFIKVCHAIQHAHQKGIIHRDIKPANVLVTVNDGLPVPKVIDFGIAKATQGELSDKTIYTQFQQFIGTPAYMSPEQADMTSLDIDTRSDIYSLGVLLYELLTGKTPFDQQTLLKAGVDGMRRMIREQEPPRPSTRVSALHDAERTTTAKRRGLDAPKLVHLLRGDLDWIVMKCLEKDRTRRYETANGLAMDAGRHLNNEPVIARPPSPLYRLQKLARRNKLAFAAGGMVVVALAAGFGISTWMFLREKEARQRAVAAEKVQTRLREEAETARTREMQMRLRSEADGRFTQARFLFRNADSAGAEKQLDAVEALLAEMNRPMAAATFADLGAVRAGQGQWKEAAASYRKALEHHPDNFEHYHWLTPTLIRSGDLDGYNRLRREMLERFGNTTDPRIGERIVKDCLIMPWPDGDLSKLDRLANLGLSGETNHWALAYFQFAKGLAEHRQGRPAAAVEWVQRALGFPKADINRQVQAHMVLAMAYHQLKQTNAALASLAEGIQYAQKRLPSERGLTDYVGWNDWVFAQTLIVEARTLIEGGSTVPKPKSELQREAAAQYRNEAEQEYVQALNKLAWRLATSPYSEIRDGLRARDLAERAVTATARREPAILDTLAAAYAEAGEFANAVRTANEALALLPDGEIKKEVAARLKLFESNKPYREFQ